MRRPSPSISTTLPGADDDDPARGLHVEEITEAHVEEPRHPEEAARADIAAAVLDEREE